MLEFNQLNVFQIIVRTDNCTILLDNPIDRTAPSKVFTFDNAYDSKAPTEAIYNDICYSLVEVITNFYFFFITVLLITNCNQIKRNKVKITEMIFFLKSHL